MPIHPKLSQNKPTFAMRPPRPSGYFPITYYPITYRTKPAFSTLFSKKIRSAAMTTGMLRDPNRGETAAFGRADGLDFALSPGYIKVQTHQIRGAEYAYC